MLCRDGDSAHRTDECDEGLSAAVLERRLQSRASMGS